MKLRQTIVFGNANEDRESGWSKHIEYVDWIDDERSVYTAPLRFTPLQRGLRQTAP